MGAMDGLNGAASGASTGAALGPWGAAVGGVAGGIAGLLGGGDDAQEKARQAQLAALAAMQGVTVPQLQEMLAQSQAGDSAASSLDPSGRNAQLRAIQGLSDVYASGGYTMGDRVAQEQAMSKAAQYEQGQRGAITQDMAARGQLGGGAELAAKLSAQQAGATNAYQAGSSAAASAQQRALEAMMGQGQAGNALTTQDLAKAQAKDTMAAFNAAQRSGAYQNQFTDQMAKAQGSAGGQQGLANYYGADANRQRGVTAGVGQAIGAGINAYGKWKKDQPGDSPPSGGYTPGLYGGQ